MIEQLTGEAPGNVESALLLRDLYEVLVETERREGERVPQANKDLYKLKGELDRVRFGGEEVLF